MLAVRISGVERPVDPENVVNSLVCGIGTAGSAESVVFLDAGYIGVKKREEIDSAHPRVEFILAAKRGKIKAMSEGKRKELRLALEKAKSQIPRSPSIAST